MQQPLMSYLSALSENMKKKMMLLCLGLKSGEGLFSPVERPDSAVTIETVRVLRGDPLI